MASKLESQSLQETAVLDNAQKILTEIRHQFWDKIKMIYVIEIIFRSHEPFQSYQLTGQA